MCTIFSFCPVTRDTFSKRFAAVIMTWKGELYEVYLSIIIVIGIYIRWFRDLLFHPTGEGTVKQQWNVEDLARAIAERPPNSRIQVERKQRKHPTNSIARPPSSTQRANTTEPSSIHRIQLGVSNRILSIDRTSKTVRCEPGVTMEELVDALLEHDLLPMVVPEFKALTVGGLLAGAGLESSSFRYGQFADSLIEATYILSNGQVITCSPMQHSELFYGALGSCGTFGLLVDATFRLTDIPSNCFVRCRYVRTNEPIEQLSSFNEDDEDYLDGIVFADYSVIIRGKRIQGTSITTNERVQRFSRAWDPWFYQHVKHIHTRSSHPSVCEYIPLRDYLFRYDRGAFWMGRYPINPFQDHVHYFPAPIQHWLNLLPFGGYNLISRTLLSPLFTTAALYKRLHASSTSVINDMLVIQDVYIPLSKSKQFLHFLQSGQLVERTNEPLEPIWLCPIRSCSTAQKMSPHYLDKCAHDRESLMMDFGVWTHHHSWKLGSSSAKKATKLLETETHRLDGRKMFYGTSFYSEEQWASIYDVQWYKDMKDKWDPDYAWGDLYRKIVHS